MIHNGLTGKGEWRSSGFYGDPMRSRRRRSWEFMEYLRREFDKPWLCVRDLNKILCASEQLGGKDMEEWKMEGFRDTVEYC
jgi:hypothetical protein